MNNQRDHKLCDSRIIEGFGLNQLSENQSMNVPRPNVICYNLALKSILMNGVSLLNDDTAKSNDSIPHHLEWTFMEMAILEPMKSLEFSSDFFVTHKLLIQICSMNLDVMIKNIHLMEKEIKQDQETQDA